MQGEAALVIGVDQLLGGRGRLGQNAQPSERIDPVEDRQRSGGNRRPAYAVKTVAPGDEVADHFLRIAVRAEENLRMRVGAGNAEVVHGQVLGLEKDAATGGQARVEEVRDNLVLRIDDDCLAARKFLEIDAVTAPAEAQFHAVVIQALALQPLAHARFDHQVGGALFEHAGADALLDILAAARFD